MTDVVVTGAGVVSPLGVSVKETMEGLWSNKVAVAPSPWAGIEGAPFAWWAVVPGFVPSDWMSSQVEAGTDLFSQFAIAAATQAVDDAGLADLDPRRTAVVIGTSMGGTRALMKSQYEVDTAGAAGIDRKMMIQTFPNMAASQISMRWGLHGPQMTVCTACASSIDAIGTATQYIASGQADVAIVGASEGGFCLANGQADGEFLPAMYAGQAAYGMTTGERDPLRASLPFDRDRSGIVTADGAAALILESAEHASRRDAKPRARVLGYGSLADGFHPSSPEPTGEWEAEAMNTALANAGVKAEDVDVLVAHATATPKGDAAEIAAINRVFGGESGLKVTSLKGHLGHTGASAGAIGVIASMHAMEVGSFPNVAGTTNVDPAAQFDVVTREPVPVDVRIAQVNAFGFGGQDASLVIEAVA